MNIQKIMTKVVSLMAVAILYVASTASVVANQNDVVVLYLNDPLGSAVAAYDENGNVCWEETHAPYGDKTVMEDSFNRASCGVVIEERGFTGHTDDYETDLVYMQQRYYDPTVGRFLSTDPVGPKVGSPKSINRYSYAANNPYKYIDPNGEEFVLATAIGYGVVAAGATITATETYSTYRRDGATAAIRTLAIGAVSTAIGGKVAQTVVKYGGGRVSSFFKSKFKSELDIPNSAGRGKNKLEPDSNAEGDHTAFQRGVDGKIYKYETYEKTSSGYWNPVKRYDGGKPDGSAGAPHFNKQTGESVPTPHVQGKSIPGGGRPAEQWEIPK